MVFVGPSTLAPGGTAGVDDVFAHVLASGVTERISKNNAGAAGDKSSGSPGISANGRFIAFTSLAGNLVPGDTNGTSDAFLHDRQTGVTERVSVSSEETQANGAAIFGPCQVSDDGQLVAFVSRASNLVQGDTDALDDVFIRNRAAGLTEIISVSSSEAHATDRLCNRPQMTPDGRFVTFYSASANLVPNDTNGLEDAFLRDRSAGTTERVSIGAGGAEGNGYSFAFDLSDDARFIAFTSNASNLVPGDTNQTSDGFVRDRELGATERVTVTALGQQASGGVSAMTPDTRFLVISSNSSALVSGDTNGVDDVFVSTYESASGNRPPNADAGPDQTVETQAQSADVTLNGAESTDPDGDDLTFAWTEAGEQIAAGKSPTVTLGVGAHEITLEVKDTSGARDTDVVVITVEAGPPAGDFPLEAAALDSKRIQLKWKDPSTKERSFLVERSDDDGRTWVRKKSLKAVSGRGRNLSWIDKTVVAAIQQSGRSRGAAGELRVYRYRIRITQSRLEEMVSQVRFAFVLAAPVNLRIANWQAINSTTVPLAWEDRSFGETGFEIERVGGNTQTAAANTGQLTFTGLSPETDYQFRVRAIGSSGPSSWSNTFSVTTPPAGGNGSGFADFGDPRVVISTNRGSNTQFEIRVNNNEATPLEVWINDPTPLKRQGSGVLVGYRVPAGRRQVTIAGNAQNQRVTTLTLQAEAGAPVGPVPGELVLYTSDPRSRVVVFSLQGTVR